MLIFWRDDSGVVHACEVGDIHDDVRLVWTFCDRDVPADAAYLAEAEEVIICPTCRAKLSLPALPAELREALKQD
jgi:hypothetical protein